MKRTLYAMLFAMSALLSALPQAANAADTVQDVVRIPVDDGRADMATGVFRPSGDGPFPVLVYSHGRSGTEAERSNTKFPDPRGHITYWLNKGFAVVAPIRPGYGDTGGPDRENSGVGYDMFGNCWGRPDFARSAANAARAVLAALKWVRQQPWAEPKRIVLEGTSMGGLASIAAAAMDPEGVAGYINFAGGTGGHGKRSPEHSCGSDTMATLMSEYGRTTHVPSLWLYAENDLFWGSEWPRAWHRAFAVGGSRTEFVMTPPVPHSDGHQLLARGSRLWAPTVDRFLGELGF